MESRKKKILPEKLRKRSPVPQNFDIGQDGLVSIASVAYKDNGSQLLSK